MTDIIHVDDEGVRRAAATMTQAAVEMVRAANLIDETLTRFIIRFEEAVTMIGDNQ